MRLVILFLFISISGYSQIINIENKRFYNDTSKFMGNVEFELTSYKNKNEVLTLGNSADIQYKTKKHKVIFVYDINLSKTNGSFDESDAYFHIRYNYKLSNYFTFEAFAQDQYNKPLKIDKRQLIGTGLRLKVIEHKLKIYHGSIILYEYEVNKSDDVIRNNIRLSEYMVFIMKLSDNTSIIENVYYQPNIHNFNDYRLVSNLNIDFDINEHLSFELAYSVMNNTNHGIGIPSETWKLENKFKIKF